ncbi:MAG TPA: family 2A encapsulin nanocompartment cargo protein cysteine desulfurase [Terriglobales bacterium]|nr:family 2A encapsulin nanocompartment cargo protein cysteine desulfurase [Terriglobales bacterium]
MSTTSDPFSVSLPAPDAGAGSVPQNLPGGMAALPDPAVIARLANQFFAALPGNASPAGAPSAWAPSSTPPTEAALPALPAAAAGAGALAPKTPDVPTALPGEFVYFLEGAKMSPLSVTPSFPSLPEVFSFPGVPGAQSPPNVPGAPASNPTPQAESDLRAIPSSSPSASALSPSASNAALPATSPGFSSYFFDGEKTLPLTDTPSFPAVSEMFSFPGVPGAQSFPSVPGPPSSPTEPNLGALSKTGLAPAVPGTSAFTPAGEKSTPAATATPRIETFEFRPDLVPSLGLSARPFDPHLIRRDFPILQEQVNGRPLVWLDNAATTQKPNAVIDRLSYFYRHENSNIHRAAHTLAARATDAYESAREKVRRFLNASSTREIIFVRGTTEAINLVAQSWGRRHVQKDDEVVITWLEHHANIVPWQQLCSEKGARLRVAPVDDRGQVILEEYEKLLGPRTRLVSFSQVSNALGTITPAREMVEIAHRYGARVLVDGAQAVSHMQADVQLLNCDFYVFSGHKIFGPTGIGVVFGKLDVLDNTPPWQGGGNMITDVSFEKTTYQVPPGRFEAGTGNIADAIGLGAALDYVQEIGLESISRYEHDLLTYATTGLNTVPGLRLIGTAAEKAGVLSFVLDGFRTEDVGTELSQEGIAVRAGHHCAQPIHRRFGVESTVRPSLALYNTCEEIDALVAALLRIQSGRGHRGL